MTLGTMRAAAARGVRPMPERGRPRRRLGGGLGFMKVLIAEDDAVSRRLLQSFLEKWGYQVVVARDGAEAWQRFSADSDIALVVTDWMMPGLDGLELIRRLRASARPRYVYAILLT